MTVQPYVELLFDPHDLSERARQEVAAATLDNSVSGALGRALFAQHVAVVTEARRRLTEAPEVTPALMIAVMDYTWQMFAPRFIKISGPQIAMAYTTALQAVNAGAIDPRYVESLASEHARRLTSYFHESSRDAVAEAFNTYVNRKVPVRVAADRALSAYGLSSRQIRGYTANVALFDTKISSNVFHRAEAAAMEYVAKSLRSRIGNFAKQEEHNLDQQAEQIAWLWMVDHNQLPENAEKIWLTAKDEMTCKICAPMHGKVVKVGERFELPNRTLLWVPGVHPNCRCKVRFRVPRQMEIAKADNDFDPREHPRGQGGRFRVANRPGPTFKEPERPELEVDLSGVETAEEQPQKIVMAPPEQEQKITMRPERKVRMGQVVRMSEPQTRIISGEKTVLSRPETAQKVELRDRFADVALRNKLEPVFMEMTEKIEREEVVPKILYMGVVDLTKGDGPGPMYHVINPNTDLDAGGRVEFTHADLWTNSALEASAQAVAWRRQEIQKRVRELENEPTAEYEVPEEHALSGSQLHVILSQDQIADLVGWAANQNSSAERDRTGNATMEVELYSPDYSPLDNETPSEDEWWETESIPMKDLAKMYELYPADFNMAVAVVTRGHDSELGRTDVRPSDDDTFATFSGQFEVDQTHPGETILGSENALGITFYHLEPADVEVEIVSGKDE